MVAEGPVQGTPLEILKTKIIHFTFLFRCDLGWLGVLMSSVNVNGTFSAKQNCLSINTKELLAMFYGLSGFKLQIAGKNILCHCDNTTAVSCILKKGSSGKIWNAITKRIFQLVRQLGANIYCVHISGVDNDTADRLSRTGFWNCCTEWSLAPETMNFIWSHLNFKPNIDLFASHLNYEIKPYCSFRPDPFSIRVNAFTLNWNE